MRVIATAGHVDHGKSALVRALTGMEPDRWAQEKARGLTIDLGYAWMTLPEPPPTSDGTSGSGESDTAQRIDTSRGHSGRTSAGESGGRGRQADRESSEGVEVAFVDVPGHERFIANMLAGVGPSPAVMFVVAADEGWRQQSQEHLDAVRALDIRHGVVAVTRSDLADPEPAIAQVRERLAGSALEGCEAVAVSGVTGQGLSELRSALGRLVAGMPAPDPAARVRLWLDRVFTVKGAGTVVTGTLEAGTVAVGDRFEVLASGGRRMVTVRGLESLGLARESVCGPARVALNLRGVGADELARGDVLLTPGAWHVTSLIDARLTPVPDALPDHLTAHVGTTSRQVTVRPLAEESVRLRWEGAVPLQAGDRLVLRHPGRQLVLCGAEVLDADPPALTRRGDGRRRGEELASAQAAVDVAREVGRRGFMRVEAVTALGGDPDTPVAGVRRDGDLLVAETRWSQWTTELTAVVEKRRARDPLKPGVPATEAAAALGLPEVRLIAALAQAAGLEVTNGVVRQPGSAPDLGAAEAGLAELERRLSDAPFRAPEKQDLADLRLGPRQLAAAVTLGRLIDLGDQIALAPSAPARAMRVLAALPQPFTTAQAREALGTTRRVAIPLLEHLDSRGWTHRIDAGHREVVRANSGPGQRGAAPAGVTGTRGGAGESPTLGVAHPHARGES